MEDARSLTKSVKEHVFRPGDRITLSTGEVGDVLEVYPSTSELDSFILLVRFNDRGCPELYYVNPSPMLSQTYECVGEPVGSC